MKPSSLAATLLLLTVLSCSSAQREVRDATVAHWSFEKIENSHTPDETGRFHGQVFGRPALAEGIAGHSLLLDGVSDHVLVADAPEWSFGDGPFSISAWVNVHVLHVGPQVILARSLEQEHLRNWMLKVDRDHRFRFSLWDEGWQSVVSHIQPRPGLWYHVAVTLDRGNARIYVNGALQEEAMLKSSLAQNGAPLPVNADAQADGTYPSMNISLAQSDASGTMNISLAHSDASGTINTSLAATSGVPLSIGALSDNGKADLAFYGALDEIILAREALSPKTIRFLAGASTKVHPSGYEPLLPEGWDPLMAGNEVMDRLIRVTAPAVEGAHDAEFELVGNRAYIVSTVNEEQRGHSAGLFEYAALSIVNLQTLQVEQATLPIARSEQAFENETLPRGQTWVPRIIRKDEHTLRVYFVNQLQRRIATGTEREHGSIWYRDFDLQTGTFSNRIYRAKLKTSAGTFYLQPEPFYADAAAQGFEFPPRNYGLYIFDSFKVYDGTTYVAINNFPGRQNALARMNDELDTFEIVAHMNEPQELLLSEASINRWPDGTWTAIFRSQAGNGNYVFAESEDGTQWAPAQYRGFVRNGTTSKPTFNRFNNIYYLGWQDAKRIDGVSRSVFNLDISRDGQVWERKYRFETTDAFQYPTFKEHNGIVWLTISGRNQRSIKFGMLEQL